VDKVTADKPDELFGEEGRKEALKRWREGTPSALELARIAATLAQGEGVMDGATFRNWARSALRLWEACASERRCYIEDKVADDIAMTRAIERVKNLPEPKSWPVTFDDFLKLLLPTRDKADRERLFRDYVRAQIARNRYGRKLFGMTREALAKREDIEVELQKIDPADMLPGIADKEVVADMEEHRKTQLGPAKFEDLAQHFSEWLKEEKKATKQKAATARWSNKRNTNQT
jgi:hypothetical protein